MYENLAGEEHELTFDMAMLLPPFAGVGLQAFDRKGDEITAQMFAPNGFMKVDADYTSETVRAMEGRGLAPDLSEPRLFQHLCRGNCVCAPASHLASPYSPRGTSIFATAPRTGMPSATIGRVVARSIADMVEGKVAPLHNSVHGGTWSGLRRIFRFEPAERHGGLNDRLSHCSGL